MGLFLEKAIQGLDINMKCFKVLLHYLKVCKYLSVCTILKQKSISPKHGLFLSSLCVAAVFF